MNQDHSSVPSALGRFDPTHWSLVLEAAQSEAPGGVEALAQLCKQYWPPLYAFARHGGHQPEDAQDLVQGFFEHLIGSHGLRSVGRAKGRFRSFLLASFQNYMVTEIRRARCEKRGGRAELIRLDWENAEGRLAFEPADPLTPETLYDTQWALLLLDRAINRLQQEYEESGKAQVFDTLQGFLGSEGPQASMSYQEPARALQSSVSAVRTMVHRFRRRHGELLRQEVAQTVTDLEQVDAEVHALCDSLIAAGMSVCRPGHSAVYL